MSRATVKPIKLPDVQRPATKPVRVDANPRDACFPQQLDRIKEKKDKPHPRSWVTEFKPRTNRKWTDEEINEIIRLYEEGATITELAEQFSTTYDAVQSRIKKLQAEGRCGTHNPKRKEDKQDEQDSNH